MNYQTITDNSKYSIFQIRNRGDLQNDNQAIPKNTQLSRKITKKLMCSKLFLIKLVNGHLQQPKYCGD